MIKFIAYRKNHEYLILILISILIFIWPIPGTISIRNIVTYTILVLLLYNTIKHDKKALINLYKKTKSLLFILSIFLIWLIFQALFLSEHSTYILNEIRGQFLTPIIYFIIGLLLYNYNFISINKRIILNLIFFSGFAHILIITVYATFYFLTNHNLPYRFELLMRVDEISFYTNLFYIIFLTEIYYRINFKNNFLFLNRYFMFIFFLIFIFSIYLQGMRLGVLSFISTSSFFFLILVIFMDTNKIKKIFYLFVIVIFLSTLSIYSIKKDSRWDTLIQTIPIAISSDSLYWLNKQKYEIPKLPNGKSVNLSNYLRIAQQVNGYKMIINYPFGVGYSRRAYKHALEKKYNMGYGHPHSGILNFILGVGIIGFLIYLIFLISIVKIANKNKNNEIFYIFTIIIIITYHSRALIDMTFQNHMLQLFMFFLGIGLSSTIMISKKD